LRDGRILASKDMGIALAGAGGCARMWIDAYRKLPEVRLVGIYDPDPEWAEKLARQIPECVVFNSLDDILSNADVYAVEINLPPEQAAEFAVRCVESSIAVGMRSTAIISRALTEKIFSLQKKKTPVRIFSPAFYYPPLQLARDALEKSMIGEVQTTRIKSVLGRYGISDSPIVTYPMHDAPDLCGPQFEALPLMFMIGDVKSVHVFRNRAAAVISWTSEKKRGGARYGVYEAVRSPDFAVRSPLEPVETTYEIAGTDGYIFGARLTGQSREQSAFACYIRDSYHVTQAKITDDPRASYYEAAKDLIEAARRRSAPRFGAEWIYEIALLRDAMREAIEARGEITIERER
jgi:predicted dehydrogenase